MAPCHTAHFLATISSRRGDQADSNPEGSECELQVGWWERTSQSFLAPDLVLLYNAHGCLNILYISSIFLCILVHAEEKALA